jgi:hypothetical protein
MNLFRRYIFWTEPRGNLHYDVMVTLILLFLFISPHYIDFKAKPVPDAPLAENSVLVKPLGRSQFLYEIPIAQLNGASDDASRQAAIQNVIQSLTGAATVQQFDAVHDGKGTVVAYDAVVRRSNP